MGNATQSSSSSSRYDQDNNTSKSEVSGFDISAYEKAANMTIKKSDSNSSDWLTTPGKGDDFFGLDVKGIEKDYTHFRKDPNV